jgi:hypothetical protein
MKSPNTCLLSVGLRRSGDVPGDAAIRQQGDNDRWQRAANVQVRTRQPCDYGQAGPLFPELARIGLSETEAEAERIAYRLSPTCVHARFGDPRVREVETRRAQISHMK